MINLDFSLVVTIVYVLLLYLFLRRLFFKPINQVLSDRRRLIEGSLGEANRRIEEVEQKTVEYESTVRNTRAEAYRQQEIIRARALDEKMKLLVAARRDAEKAVQEARTRLKAQSEEARRRLEGDIDALAQRLAARVLRE